MRWMTSGLWIAVACGGKADSADDSLLTDTATGGDGSGSPGPIDADRDGFEEGEDCDDSDPSVYPGAEDPCDGLDQDCDGNDGDPSNPEAWYLQADGVREDLATSLSSGARINLSGGGSLNVCGGAWDPDLMIDSNVTITASEASFSSAFVTISGANVDLLGGTWDGVLDFGGEGVGRLEAKLAGGYARAVDGYELTLHGTDLGPGKVYAIDAILNVEEAELGGEGGNLIEATNSAVTLHQVTITADGTVPSVLIERGSLTVDGLSLVDSEAGLSISGADATLVGLDVQGGAYPVSFNAASVSLSDSTFRESEGAVVGGGDLTVENCTFQGMHDHSTLFVQGTMTVRNSSFLGATSGGTWVPRQINHTAFNLSQPLLVEGCRFADATSAGSAIASNGVMTVLDSTFENLDGHGVVYLYTDSSIPLLASHLIDQVVMERIQVRNHVGPVVSGTHCPMLRDSTISGGEGLIVGAIYVQGDTLSCQNFGERLVVEGDGNAGGLRFEAGEVDFSCEDCVFDNLDGEVVYARFGELSLVGGRISNNTVHFGSALRVEDGAVRLTNVDLGSGPTENLNAAGDPGFDVQVGGRSWDGSGVASVYCTPSACP